MGLWLSGIAIEAPMLHGMTIFYFNTAMGFGVCGVAAFVLRRFPPVAFLLGCVLAGLSAITLGEYVFNWNFGVDQLLAKAPQDGNSFPGRMAETTAICFLFASVALMAFSTARNSPRVRLFGGFLGCLLFAMGGVGITGHLWGLGLSFTWAGHRSMAGMSAISFCLVGLALSAHFLGTLPHAWSARRKQFPALAGVSLAIGTVFLWNALRAYDQEGINSATMNELVSIRKQLNLSLEGRILSLDRMAKRWSFSGKIERDAWEADANLYLQHMTGIEGIAKVSSAGMVDWIVPSPVMDSVVGFDLNSEPTRSAAVVESKTTRQIQLTKTVNLRTGGRGFLAVAPSYINDTFLGNMVMVFRIDKFVPAAIEAAGYDLSIVSDGGLAYESTSAEAAADDSWARETEFKLGNLQWTLRARPKPSKVREQGSSLPNTILFVGLALATLVMTLLQMYFRSREAEENAWRSDQWQKAIIDGSDLMIVSTDEFGVVQSFNPSAESILGYSAAEVCGSHSPALWHSDEELKAMISELSTDHRARLTDVKDVFFISARANRTERKFRMLTNAEGELRRVLVSTHAFSNERGEITGYVMIGEDMTEVKANEERIKSQQAQILAASKMSSVGEMAGGVAHELNTPLNIVLAKAQQLQFLASQEGQLQAAEIVQHAGVIVSTVDRMARIIRGLRSFAREASSDPFQQADIGRLVEETIAFCSARFRSHGIELRVNVEAAMLAECREAQLSQVLLNLLNNAYEAILEQDEKWIDITARKYLTGLEIAVTNSGPHIAPEIEEKIMQPFFTTKHSGKGAGLGLSLSKGVAEAHRGWLRLDQFSQFTRFVVWIPLEQQQQQNQKAVS